MAHAREFKKQNDRNAGDEIGNEFGGRQDLGQPTWKLSENIF